MIEQLEHTAKLAEVPLGAGMDRRIIRSSDSWRYNRIVIIGLILLLASILIWSLLPPSGSTDVNSGDVEVGTVSREAFEDYLPVRATAAPRLTTLVGVLSGGQVDRLLVQDGSFVASGQPVATLANPELRLDVLTREAQIAAQLGSVTGEDLNIQRDRLNREGEIAQANYELIKARRELSIRQQLRDKGLLSQAGVVGYLEETAYRQRRLDQLRSGGVTEARITAAQSARLADTGKRLASNLAAVRAGLDTLVIRAPATGRLTNFTIQPGQTLKPGDPAGQVDSEGLWKLEADVDEFYLGRVAMGQKATANEASLTVSKVLPTVKNGRFRIELLFDDRLPDGLNRGQTLDARVTLSTASRAVVAPVGGWLASGGGNTVFVVDADGKHASRRTIRVGRRNPSQVEVLSGLAPGERIITSNLASVKGDIINIR